MDEITVEDAMTKKVVKAGPDDDVISIAKKMRKKDIGSMLVCDKGKLIGLITSEDLVKRILIPNKDPKNFKAKDVMTKELLTTTRDEELIDAIQIMIDKKIERLPVVEDGKVKGILTDGDVLRIAPHLVESLFEKDKELEEMGGDVCEICGNYSDNLVEINGQWLCENCRESNPMI